MANCNTIITFDNSDIWFIVDALRDQLLSRLANDNYNRSWFAWSSHPTLRLFRTLCRNLGEQALIDEMDKAIARRFPPKEEKSCEQSKP